MKNISRFLPLVAACLLLARCSDEQIEPNINDDMKTYASAYADQFVTIKIQPNADDSYIEFHVAGDWHDLSINWGDGTTERRTENNYDYESGRFYHHYLERAGDYTIVLSGDIDRIMDFIMEDENLKVSSIHLGGMVWLETLVLENIPDGPTVLNLSHNRLIAYFSTARTPTLTDIIVPVTNNLKYFNITGNHKLPTSVVNRVVARVHDSVINKPRQGEFKLGTTTDANSPMVGPPSSYALNKLRKLQNVYQWQVTPFVE